MPTYFRLGNGTRICIYKDHGNPHFHAIKDNAEAKVFFDGTVAWSKGFDKRSLKTLSDFATSNTETLREKWNENQEK